MTESLVSFVRALQLTLESILPLDSVTVPLGQAVGQVIASDLYARVDAPSVDMSLKDGYAVRSADIARATTTSTIHLRLIGSVAAGSEFNRKLTPGTAIRILSGAKIPDGAEAVLSEEFADDDGYRVTVTNYAVPGRNILRKGSDVHVEERLVTAGMRLRPGSVGLLASGGYSEVPIVRAPRVAIIATGDEVIAPGDRLHQGKLYASNLVTLAAWCTLYRMQVTCQIVKDEAWLIKSYLREAISASDAVVTSGGAWNSERDWVVRLLDELGWRKIYHRIKMGPGKAIGFGVWRDKPVFCLPGGPPSNEMAFIQLALPGLLKLGGDSQPGLGKIVVKLADNVDGQADWTQFIEGRLQKVENEIYFYPHKMASRLQSMSDAEAILEIPEGTADLLQGTTVQVQMLPWVTVR